MADEPTPAQLALLRRVAESGSPITVHRHYHWADHRGSVVRMPTLRVLERLGLMERREWEPPREKSWITDAGRALIDQQQPAASRRPGSE